MKKTLKRLFASLMVAVMVLTAAPLSGFVGLELPDWLGFKASATTYSGTCGDNLTWNLDTATGELVISGTGAMEDYCVDGSGDTRPWKEHCDSIKTVVVGVGITTIGDYAFFSCTELRDLILPNGITIIGNYSFNYCRNLVILTLPKSLKKIGDWTFAACTGMESVEIPNSVSSIGTWAFFCCSNLKSITIPANVTVINDFTFYCCENITDVFYNGSEEDWANINFGTNNECLTNATIHFNSSANNNSYKVGDIIEFGSYPQSEVTDTDLISILDSVSKSWSSYGYYSGSWSNGKWQTGNWMKYAEISYNGEKYRAVTFSQYRPHGTANSSSESFQDDNGYLIENVYYFIYEPLVWRVIDPEKGIVMCENIIDSQAYNNTIYYNNEEYYKDSSFITYANNYTESSIRDWLNDNFYNTAFTTSEMLEIQTTTCDNSSSYSSEYDSITTYDKIFLLSDRDTVNIKYGFSSSYAEFDTVRKAQGTDYARCQGLYVCTESPYNGYSNWWLRSSGISSCIASNVNYNGSVGNSGSVVDCNYYGVRPALKLNLQSITNPNIPDDFTESIKIGADRFTFGQDMMGTAGDTLNALLVYTSKENDINNLTITSSNPAVATVGTPEIDKGDYITQENEMRAILPITLKSAGTATITVTAPDGTSASILVDVYASMEDSQEVKAYIDEHILFANSNRYANLTTNASFYNSIWKHEEGSRNFTRYAAWDVIGRVGKFAALDFYGAFQTDNPYDVLLADVFSNYVNNEYGKSAKVFENTAKTILGAPSTFNNVLDVLKTSDAWNSELTETWKDFTDDTQKGWIDGIFLKSETFKLNDYDPAVKDLYNALTKIFKGMPESDFEKIFKGLKNTDTIFDYIGTGADMVFRFFDAYQKYLLAEALCETNEYILSSVESIARQEMSEENGKLLLDALDPYWSACYTDSAFEIVNEFAAEHGFIWSGVDTVYTYLGKGCLKEFVYAAIHSVTGIALDALGLTYNLTYLCLDYLSGLGKLDETHTLMNAAALLEKEYLELVEKEANELKNDASLENAAMFDTSWGFLQSLESYCYKTLSTYASAMKKEYTTNYVIKNSVSNNLFYTLISTNQLIKDLSACDSGIQSAVYLESEWVNSNCHNGVYSPSNVMAVKCPTDVYVYDSEGNLALSIVGNKVTLCKSNIVAFVDDDEKIFVLPTDQKYDIKITATDDGTMQYSVQCFNNLELLRTVIYDDIELTENKSYTGSIPTDNSAKTDDFNLKSETGTEIKADYDSAAKLQSGICGDDLTWTFNESTGTLTISGTGTMYDYENDNCPWEDYEDVILSVVIEDSVKSIGDCAFYDCDGLSVVTIGNSVASIGYCAFHHCDSLISVTIPDSVTFINSYAFSACVSLTSITIPNGVTTINQSTFSSCKNLKSIIIPDSVTEIHAFSFNYCYALETVIVGNGVTKIHDYAFSHCTGLKNLKLGNIVESIGSYAFQDCSSLISVVIPDTVTDILFDSFADCSALTEVTIGKSVSSIAHSAFFGCDSLADVYYNGTEVEWNEILIGFSNEPLLNATIHFLGEGICDHSYTAKVTPPTCTEQGYTTYTCECGDSYIADYVPEKGHTEGSWVVTKPATTTQTGTKTLSCSVCGTVLKTQTIPIVATDGKVHSVSVDDISMKYKDGVTLTPSINADSGVKYTVSYSSSDTDVVSVDSNGNITTNDKGSATVTVTVTDEYGNTVTDTCKVEVSYKWWQWIIVIVLFGWIWY